MRIKRTVAVVAGLLAAPLSAQVGPADFIHLDGFERLQAHRIDGLVLRDPHFFTQVLIFCTDITSQVNDQIAAGLVADDDGDGFLDNSAMLLFRPLRTDDRRALGLTGGARCTAPAAGTACQPDEPPSLAAMPYTGQSLGTCLSPLPGTTRPYSPAVGTPGGPCFASDAAGATGASATLPFPVFPGLATDPSRGAGLPLPLTSVRTAASRRESPAPGLADGLLMGFLSEAAADALVIELPGLGARPLSSLLAGGTGACPNYSDKDIHEGVSGWWFYFNYTATAVPYAE
ncbi:MAG: hypothetical protein KF823_02210 [Xanthomonadales bacterium]|nr:hypothetical protein [Xanthomonadales bacterium]